MAAQDLEPAELTAPLINEFLEPLRARGPRREWFSPTSERQLLDYLCRLGLVPAPEVSVVIEPAELLVGEFVEYLVREGGLTDGSHTVWEYERTARLFLAGRVDSDGGGLERLTAGDVKGFVLAECRHRSVRMSSPLVTSSRGLLAFLFLEGLTPTDLTGAVPGVAHWRGGSLPKALPAEQVARLLASCDRRLSAAKTAHYQALATRSEVATPKSLTKASNHETLDGVLVVGDPGLIFVHPGASENPWKSPPFWIEWQGRCSGQERDLRPGAQSGA